MSQMIQDVRVSVIIPVHNSEKYLGQCLQSVLHQTFREIEILCIDGGSTDSTPEIIKRMQSQDRRLVYIQDPHTGYGHKLNIGIDRAVGEYVMILESDDRMAPHMIRSLYDIAAEHDSDITDADYAELFCHQGKEYLHPKRKYPDKGYYGHVIQYTTGRDRYITTYGIWTALYKKEFLRRHAIRLNESEGASYQDLSFLFLTSLFAEKVCHLDMPLYQYRVDNTGSSVKDDTKIWEIVGECAYLKTDLERRGIRDAYIWELYYTRKYNAYYWNYCRLSPEAGTLFLKTYREDLEHDQACGAVSREMFQGYMYQQTFFLSDTPDQFQKSAHNKSRATWAAKFCRLLESTEGRDIILFGAGIYGSELADLLQQNENRLCGICDNSESVQGTEKNGFRVMPVEAAAEKFRDALFLLTSRRHTEGMKRQLTDLGIKEANIISAHDW